MKTLNTKQVAFVGDIHGAMNHLQIAYNKIPDGTPLVQVGDFGMGFILVPDWVDEAENIFFIRGNHDSPDLCRHHPAWIPDGSVCGKTMFVGGAWSIDHAFRTPGVSWWPDEQLSYQEMDEIEAVYRSAKPDIMVTHDMPSSFMRVGLFSKQPHKPQIMTATGEFLSHLHSIHAPKLWIGGHWHMTIRQVHEGTNFVVLAINETILVDTETFEITTVVEGIQE